MIRRTSIDAYHTIKNQGLLSKRRLEVYEILFHHGPLTAHEVVQLGKIKSPNANQTGWNARLSELETQGVVIKIGEKLNPISNQHNILWDVTDNLPIKLDRPKKIKCEHCNGKGHFTEQQTRFGFN